MESTMRCGVDRYKNGGAKIHKKLINHMASQSHTNPDGGLYEQHDLQMHEGTMSHRRCIMVHIF